MSNQVKVDEQTVTELVELVLEILPKEDMTDC